MSVYIDGSNQLHHDHGQSLALTCPHCLVLAHITPLSIPRFSDLNAYRPRQIGIVYRCDACNAPVFLRFNVRGYGIQRVELSSQFSQIERPREKFSYTYLPEAVETLFREALLCYSHGAFNAFASMCRRTMQAAFAQLGDKLRLFDELSGLRELAQIDAASFAAVKRVIFGSDSDPAPNLPPLDDDQAGLLLEVMKDLLHQAYVRRGRLQQAMLVRRFFCDQDEPAATGAASASASASAAEPAQAAAASGEPGPAEPR